MSGRRRFGSVVSRTSRDGKRRYVEARYQPPVWAYAKWPDLPKHYSRRFDADYTAMAAAWLADVERVFCQVVIGQCGVSFPSEKAVGFSPVRNWPVIARVLLFNCIRA